MHIAGPHTVAEEVDVVQAQALPGRNDEVAGAQEAEPEALRRHFVRGVVQ